MKRTWVDHTVIIVGVAIILAFYFLPLYWILATSFKTEMEIYNPVPSLWPREFTLHSYRVLFQESNFEYYLRNSMIVSTTVALFTVVLTSTAAYAISKKKFKGRNMVANSFLLAYLFPGILLVIPMYGLAIKSGLYDTLLALIVFQVLYTFPFGIWTLKTFFDNIPKDLTDAAIIDGAQDLRILWEIYIPLIAPAVGTVFVYSFVLSWNEYLFSLILLDSDTLRTVSLGIAAWADQTLLSWGPVAAGAVLGVLPAIALFTLVNKFFTKGAISGSVKG